MSNIKLWVLYLIFLPVVVSLDCIVSLMDYISDRCYRASKAISLWSNRGYPFFSDDGYL